MRLKDRRIAFFDTETTGLDPNKHDIIEFGISYLGGDTISHRVKPVNIEPAEAARLIPKLLNYCVVVGHNIQYDVGMVRGLFKKLGLPEPPFFGFPSVDTMGLACFLFAPHGLTRLSLKEVCMFLGIDPESDVHRAAAGAQKCGEVYQRMMAVTKAVPTLVLGETD